ncbi:MAG: hypothetical protein OHK0038_00360 [Flammeovirgaceae bacterium]
MLLIAMLPQMIIGIPDTLPVLYHALIGESLQDGKTLYAEVYDNTPPLAAGVYWIFHSIFDRFSIALTIFSILLIVFQAFIFGLAINSKEVYSEKNYLPSLFYGIFMLISFDFATLPPALMAQTFLLLMLRNLLKMNEDSSEQDVFMTAAYLGIASLFYIPCVAFLLVTLIGSVLFSSFTPRHLLLILYGFILVLASALTYFFYFGSVESIFEQFFVINVPTRNYARWEEVLWLMLIPSFLIVASFFKIFQDGRFIVYQTNTQLLMGIWLFVAVLTLIFSNEFATYQLILFVPPLSFFTTHFILLTKRLFLTEIYGWTILLTVLLVNYNSLYGWIPSLQKVDYQKMYIKEMPDFEIQGKKILVLGDDISYYKNNQPTCPYLNWKLSRKDFDYLDQYEAIVRIAKQLENNYPDVVVDPQNLMNKLLIRIPAMKEMYEKKENGVYVKVR